MTCQAPLFKTVCMTACYGKTACSDTFLKPDYSSQNMFWVEAYSITQNFIKHFGYCWW